VTLFDVLRATDYVTPALEIIDARIEQFDRDTGAPRKVVRHHRGFLPPTRASSSAVSPSSPDAVDLRWVGALLYKNAVIEETGPRGGRAESSPPRASRGWPTRSRHTAKP